MKKIVLVDDYVDLVDMQKLYIQNRIKDAKCTAFSNPLEALEYISNQKDIDVLLTDYQMPQMNGFVLAKKVLEQFPDIRVIISSGHDVTTLLKLSNEFGLEGKVAVMTKAGDIDYLISLINLA